MESPLITIGPSVCFKVQKIIGVSVGEGNSRNYQVQWAPSWVSGFHLVGCEHLIQEFTLQQSEKVQFFDENCYGGVGTNNRPTSYGELGNAGTGDGDRRAEALFNPLVEASSDSDGSTTTGTNGNANFNNSYPNNRADAPSPSQSGAQSSLEDEIQITSYYSVSRTPTEGDDIKIVFVESQCKSPKLQKPKTPIKKRSKPKRSPVLTPELTNQSTHDVCSTNAGQMRGPDNDKDMGSVTSPQPTALNCTNGEKNIAMAPRGHSTRRNTSNQNMIKDNLVEDLMEAMELATQSEESGSEEKRRSKSAKCSIPVKTHSGKKKYIKKEIQRKEKDPPTDGISAAKRMKNQEETAGCNERDAPLASTEQSHLPETSHNGHTAPPPCAPKSPPAEPCKIKHPVSIRPGKPSIVIEMPDMDQVFLRKYCPEPMELITLAPSATPPPTIEPPKFECDQCFRIFQQHSALARHVTRTHNRSSPAKERKYKHTCDQCSKGFQRYTCFIKHMVRIHGADPPEGADAICQFQCQLCPRAFSKSSSLSRHLTGTHLRSMGKAAIKAAPFSPPGGHTADMNSVADPSISRDSTEPSSLGVEPDASEIDNNSPRGEGKEALHRRLKIHRTYPSRNSSAHVHVSDTVTSPTPSTSTTNIQDNNSSFKNNSKEPPVDTNGDNNSDSRHFFDALNLDRRNGHQNGCDDELERNDNSPAYSKDTRADGDTLSNDVNKYILFNKPQYSLDTDNDLKKNGSLSPTISEKGESSKVSTVYNKHCKSNGSPSAVVDASYSETKNKTRGKTNNTTARQPKSKYRCHECGKMFPKSAALARHFNKTHGVQGGIFECGICQLKFKTPAGIRKHMHIHMTPRKSASDTFTCYVCDKIFGSSGKLQRHLQGHTAERPYQCPTCSRRFKRRDHMARHMQLHVKNGDISTSPPEPPLEPLPDSVPTPPLEPSPAPSPTPENIALSRLRKTSGRMGVAASRRANKASKGSRMKPSKRSRKRAVKVSMIKSEPLSEGPPGPLSEGPPGPLSEGPPGLLSEGPPGALSEGPSGPLSEGPSGPLSEGPLEPPFEPLREPTIEPPSEQSSDPLSETRSEPQSEPVSGSSSEPLSEPLVESLSEHHPSEPLSAEGHPSELSSADTSPALDETTNEPEPPPIPPDIDGAHTDTNAAEISAQG